MDSKLRAKVLTMAAATLGKAARLLPVQRLRAAARIRAALPMKAKLRLRRRAKPLLRPRARLLRPKLRSDRLRFLLEPVDSSVAG
jgi:hypothetical protein